MADNKMAELISLEYRIKKLKKELKKLEEEEEELLEYVNNQMEIDCVDVIEDEDIKISKVKSSTQRRFDVKGFGVVHPSLLEEFTQEVERKGSIKIKLKGE